MDTRNHGRQVEEHAAESKTPQSLICIHSDRISLQRSSGKFNKIYILKGQEVREYWRPQLLVLVGM